MRATVSFPLPRLFWLLSTTLALATGCPDTADADACCDCLANTAPDGSGGADGETNCLFELEDGNAALDEELEECSTTMQIALFAGENSDDGFDQGLSADGCREVCEDECAPLDPMVFFETPVVSAGTFSVTRDGTTTDATFVRVGTGEAAEEGTVVTGVHAETPDGDWELVMNAVTGPGSYPIADFSDFELLSPDMGDAIDGTYEITTIDDRRLTGTFVATLPNGAPTDETNNVAVSGSFDVDYTVNDGEEGGIRGLH